MTAEEELLLLRGYLEVGARLEAGFRMIERRSAGLLPITADGVVALSMDDENVLLAFLKRYEQFEDALNRTLKLLSKLMEHGKIERLTSVDVTRRAHALGILDSEKVWADAVRVRNELAHEYPMDRAKQAKQMNRAWEGRETLYVTWAAIQRFVQVEGLLP